MNNEVRKIQKKILNIFSKDSHGFALAGGTALELFYLHHRFSNDLDFFNADYNEENIEELVRIFKEGTGLNIEFESEYRVESRARVRFYITEINMGKPFKIDFIEDVFFKDPEKKRIDGVPVYGVKEIYYMKIAALAGTGSFTDETGREIATGRNAAKDVFDIYCLSKKTEPLHKFLKKTDRGLQRRFIFWYRSFSRQDLKLNLLDLDIYDENFDSSGMIRYIEQEVKEFVRGVT